MSYGEIPSGEIDPSKIEWYKSPEEIYLSLAEERKEALETALFAAFGPVNEIPTTIKEFLTDSLESGLKEVADSLSKGSQATPLQSRDIQWAMRAFLHIPSRFRLLLSGYHIDLWRGDERITYTLDSLTEEDLNYLAEKHNLATHIGRIRRGERDPRVLSLWESDNSDHNSRLLLKIKGVENKFHQIFSEAIKKNT